MKKPRVAKRSSDEVVIAKTGKPWAEWFKILDKSGAKKMTHTEIASFLYDKKKVPGWWSQMVAVGYEHERGIREKFQDCNGNFAANASRTMSVPISKAFAAWTDDKLRKRWLPGAKIEITTATPGKSLRAKWDTDTRLSVYFYSQGPEKTRVVADHMKLTSSKEVVKMKSYWTSALEKMEQTIAR
ncbi:MAG: hypothetical protein WBP79_08005 [Candidatus Acidiferrales bacterium]